MRLALPFLRVPFNLRAGNLAMVIALLLPPLGTFAETSRPRPAPAHARADLRADSVLPHLREGRADLAWAATAQWKGTRDRPLTEVERRREAVRVAMRLRDTNQYRTAAAFAAEIDRQLATAEASLRESRGTRALETVSAEARAEESRILDLRASLAVGFRMDTAAARQLRARSAELAPERLPVRLKSGERTREPGGESAPGGTERPSTEGGRP